MARFRVLLLLFALLATACAPSASAERPAVACLRVDVDGAVRSLPPEPSCSTARLLVVEARVRDGEADLTAAFAAPTLYHAPKELDTSAFGDLDPHVPAEEVRVLVHVKASWDAGCAQARATARLFVDGEPAAEVPTLAAGPLCGLSPPPLSSVLDALALLAADLTRDVPAAGASLDELLAALPRDDGAAPPSGEVGTAPTDEEPGDADDAAAEGTLDASLRPREADADWTADGSADAPGLHASLASASAPARKSPRAAPPDEPAPPAAETLLLARPSEPPSTPARLEPPAFPFPEPDPRAFEPDPAPRAPEPDAAPASHAPPGPEPDGSPALAVTMGAGLLLLAALVLYQRVARSKALEHPSRKLLHETCRLAGAPLTASELGARVGLPTKTALYHLRYLARLGLLREDRAPGRPAAFAVHGAPPAAQPESLESRIRDALARRPGMSAADLARELDVKYGTLDPRLKAMLCEGRLESRVEAGRRAYFPAG